MHGVWLSKASYLKLRRWIPVYNYYLSGHCISWLTVVFSVVVVVVGNPRKFLLKSQNFIAVVRQQFVMGINCSDFSVPELVRSQSTFSTDPEVLQNCTGFTLCSSASPAVGECSAVMGLTPCLCVQIFCVFCVLDYYLLNSQLWIQDWEGLCFGNLCVCWVLLRVWLPQTVDLHRLLKFSTQK